MARPEHGVYAKFARFVNEYDKVMTENFAKCFVDHRNVGLAPQAVAKFALHHRERGFNVMVVSVIAVFDS